MRLSEEDTITWKEPPNRFLHEVIFKEGQMDVYFLIPMGPENEKDWAWISEEGT